MKTKRSKHRGNVYIYALIDPRDDALRYVGKSVDVLRRYKGHVREMFRRDTPVYRWMRELKADGLLPLVATMAVCGQEAWESEERRLIKEFRADLLNVAPGGNAPYCDRETRARNGRQNAAIVHGDPTRRRAWELNQKIGRMLKDGFVSDRAKAKLRTAAQKRPDLFGRWASV